MAQIDAFFQKISLPSMPDVAHQLIRTLHDEGAHVSRVSELLSRDAALSARLLRLANSAQFGLPRAVGTIDDAISLVGMMRVRMLALGACLVDGFPNVPGLDRSLFWTQSMACAGYAQWIAQTAGINGQVAWLAGMMLRLGELLIAQADPEVLQQIEQLPHIPGVRWQREQRLVGFTEGQITAELARRWNFPPQLEQALRCSADPMGAPVFSRLGAVLHIAGLLAECPTIDDEALAALPHDVMMVLALEPVWMRQRLPDRATFIDVS